MHFQTTFGWSREGPDPWENPNFAGRLDLADGPRSRVNKSGLVGISGENLGSAETRDHFQGREKNFPKSVHRLFPRRSFSQVAPKGGDGGGGEGVRTPGFLGCKLRSYP